MAVQFDWPPGEDVVVVARKIKRLVQVPGEEAPDHLGVHPKTVEVDDVDYYVVDSPVASGATQLFHGAAELNAHLAEIQRLKDEAVVTIDAEPPPLPPQPSSPSDSSER